MMSKREDFECDECAIQFIIEHETKETVMYCPFCNDQIYLGEEIHDLELPPSDDDDMVV